MGHLVGSTDPGWACVEKSMFLWCWLGLIHMSGRQQTIS